MAGKTRNRRTGGSGSVFQDSKGRWHFRKDMGTDPATGRRRPPIEATGMVKSEARARFQAKIAEWERDGRLPSKDGPKTADYFERWMEEHRAAIQSHHMAQRIQLDAHHRTPSSATYASTGSPPTTSTSCAGDCAAHAKARPSTPISQSSAPCSEPRNGTGSSPTTRWKTSDECRRTGTNAPSSTSPTQRRSSRPRSPSPIRRSPCSTARTSVRSGHSCSNSPSPRACGRGRGMA